MFKREVLLGASTIFLILLLAIAVLGAPDASVDIKPVSVYETNEIQYNLSINNMGGSEVISDVKVDMQGFEITDMVNYLGWEEFFNNTVARWFDGDLENNVWALFRFNARAGLVDNDEEVDIEIVTEDEDGEETIDRVPVTIRNDDTAPSINNTVPCDGCFLREGNEEQDIGAEIEDPETGVLNASMTYYNCTNTSAVGEEEVVVLACNDSECIEQIDVSDYEEGDVMCFEFEAYNNALESSNVNGSVGFDGTPPEVSLLEPENRSYASSNTDFLFNATDNLAPDMDCEFVLDGDVVEETVADNAEITAVSHDFTNISEGNHQWNVRCVDRVGLEATSETRDIIVDKTAPTIELVSPENGSVIGDEVMIDVNVSDNYEVSAVGYSAILNSSGWPEGDNELEVNATDGAGNEETAVFVFTVDRTKPTLTIISPEDNATNDVHIDFEFNVTDNIDEGINCSLIVDGAVYESTLANEYAVFSLVMDVDNYSWYISCVDDAGNVESSDDRDIEIVDLSGPDVVIEDITQIARGEDYDFDMEVTDPSGVDHVSASIEGSDIGLNNENNTYSGTIITDMNYSLGNYDIEISANDTLGNPTSVTETFELVQGYNISLDIEPSTVEPEQEVIVSGNVVLDNGNDVPEDKLTIYLPGEEVNVSIENGSFEYTFDAPSDEGEYDIEVSVVSGDGFDHRKSEILTVETNTPDEPEQTSDDNDVTRSSSSGGSGADRLYCGDGVCTTAGAVNEDCEVCPQDCGMCPIEEVEEEDEPQEDPFESDGGFLVEDEEIPEEEAREPSGIGQATGIFDLGSIAGNVFAWIVFLMLAAGLYYWSRNNDDKVDWKGYFK